MPADAMMHLAGNMHDRYEQSLAGLVLKATTLGPHSLGKSGSHQHAWRDRLLSDMGESTHRGDCMHAHS